MGYEKLDNSHDALIIERLQICAMIEYMDSLNDGSQEAVIKLRDHSLKVQVGKENLEMKIDQNSFDAVYNMLLELRNINGSRLNER